MPRVPIDKHPRFANLEAEFESVWLLLQTWQAAHYSSRRLYWQALRSHPHQRLETAALRSPVRGTLPTNETQGWDEVTLMHRVFASYWVDVYDKGGNHPGWILVAEIQYDAGDGVFIYRRERYFGPRSDDVFLAWRRRAQERD